VKVLRFFRWRHTIPAPPQRADLTESAWTESVNRSPPSTFLPNHFYRIIEPHHRTDSISTELILPHHSNRIRATVSQQPHHEPNHRVTESLNRIKQPNQTTESNNRVNNNRIKQPGQPTASHTRVHINRSIFVSFCFRYLFRWSHHTRLAALLLK
jgi:hypothetical protein